jgi:hypothetical protein
MGKRDLVPTGGSDLPAPIALGHTPSVPQKWCQVFAAAEHGLMLAPVWFKHDGAKRPLTKRRARQQRNKRHHECKPWSDCSMAFWRQSELSAGFVDARRKKHKDARQNRRTFSERGRAWRLWENQAVRIRYLGIAFLAARRVSHAAEEGFSSDRR